MTDPGQISAPCADSRTLKDCRSCSPTTRAAISVGLPSMMIFTLSPPFAPHAESCPLAAGAPGSSAQAHQKMRPIVAKAISLLTLADSIFGVLR